MERRNIRAVQNKVPAQAHWGRHVAQSGEIKALWKMKDKGLSVLPRWRKNEIAFQKLVNDWSRQNSATAHSQINVDEVVRYCLFSDADAVCGVDGRGKHYCRRKVTRHWYKMKFGAFYAHICLKSSGSGNESENIETPLHWLLVGV